MTDPTGAVPQDHSTPAVPTVAPVPPVPLTPPAYDSSPYVAPQAPAYDAASQDTTPYPEASAPQASATSMYAPPAYAPPAYAPPAYPAPAYASYPPAQYPSQTTPGAPPVMPYGYGGYAPRKTNGLAIASMILSILGIIWVLPLVGSLIGVIMGHLSLGQLKRTGDAGRGMALAGVIVGWVGLAIIALVIVFVAIAIVAGTTDRYSTYGA